MAAGELREGARGGMMEIGVCLDALNPAACPHPADYPFGWARLVAKDDVAFYGYVAVLQAAGVHVAIVLARETFDDAVDRASIVQRILTHVKPAAVIVGNEEDEIPPEDPNAVNSSWFMPPSDYGDLWHECAGVAWRMYPDVPVLVGGLVSGIVDRNLLYINIARYRGPQPSGADVHPYAKDANAAQAYLLELHEAAKLNLWVMEWNRSAAEITGYVAMLETVGVPVACWYAWNDNQAAEPLGLVDLTGSEKPEMRALLTAAQGGMTMDPDIQALIAQYAADAGTVYNPAPGSQFAEIVGTDGFLAAKVPGAPGAYALVDITLYKQLEARVAALEGASPKG